MPSDHTPRLTHHWWPRPGWRPDRISCTWLVTYEHAPEIHAAVAAQHRAVAHLPDLDPIPVPWLHSTIQGMGWADEIDHLPSSIDSVTGAVADLPAFDVTYRRPLVRGEAVLMRPDDPEPWHALWHAVRGALPDAFPATDVFRPHLSTAYANADADATPYAAALDGLPGDPVTTTVAGVTLVRQERVDRLYRWTPVATAPLGG